MPRWCLEPLPFREVDTLLWFPVRTHSIITFTSRMAASGHDSVAHRVKLRLMVHMVPGLNPAWDFLSGKREGGLKPPEWLLVHKGPSLSLVPSPGPRGCNCLCLAHARKCCVPHAGVFNKSVLHSGIFNKPGSMPASSISLVLPHFLQIQFLPFWTEKSLKP